MSPFDMVAFIVLVSVVGGLMRTWIKSRPASGAGGMTADQEARMTKLEERIKALETVVGDQSYELKQKFKDLERA